jgi:hypothetical protein
VKPGGVNSGIARIIVKVDEEMVGSNACGGEAIDDTAEGFSMQCRILAVLRNLMFDPSGDGAYQGVAGIIDGGLLSGTCRYLPVVKFGQFPGISSQWVVHGVAADRRQEELGGRQWIGPVRSGSLDEQPAISPPGL